MVNCLTLFARLRVLAMLLLAVVGLQAAVPIRAPLDRVPGPAFSAATLDVSLASTWRMESKARPAGTMPATLAALPRMEGLVRLSVLLAGADLRPTARGPPPRAAPSRPPDSTAPPLA